MSLKLHFQLLAKYNAWANKRLYNQAKELSDDLYRRDVGAYFGSLHGTLNHLLTSDRIWLRRLTGSGEHPDRLNSIVFDDLTSLTAARFHEDERIIRYVDSLTEPLLDETWNYLTLNGTPQKNSRKEVLAHLFNHHTHHRGQAHTILTALGVKEPQPLDLLYMYREL